MDELAQLLRAQRLSQTVTSIGQTNSIRRGGCQTPCGILRLFNVSFAKFMLGAEYVMDNRGSMGWTRWALSSSYWVAEPNLLSVVHYYQCV